NLSTRPFPAYRLINVALVSALVVLIALSVWQAVGFVRFSNMARAIRSSEEEARVESKALGERVSDLGSRLDRPEAAAKLSEIEFLNNLIARKNFSWTRLFGDLENMVPDSVRLITLTQSVGNTGVTTLSVNLRGKSIADVTEFVERLENSAVFKNVVVMAEERDDKSADVDITLTTSYFPQGESR
ncbi:MAG: PilN domain-containing protein, partial [Acidobacteria bacterium]|nr:PilN domain-containing protein [Acidobacteriota bacterium]